MMMNPADLIPIADPIAVPWQWFQALLLAGFFIHLLVMNAMLGTALICLAERLRPGRRPSPGHEVMARQLPFIIAFTINAGIVPLLFLQVLYGNFIYTSSILMARWWMGAIPVLLAVYAGAYWHRGISDSRAGLKLTVLAATVVCMLAMAFVLTNNMTLMLMPETWRRYFQNPGGSLLNLDNPMFWPRYLHMLTGALAMGGLFRAVVGRWRLHRGNREGSVLVKSGLGWFVAGSALQVGVGFWLLLALRTEVMTLMLGRDPRATTLLIAALAGAGLALMFAIQARVLPAVAAALTTVGAMVLIRDVVRRAYLDGYFVPEQLQYTTRYGPFLFFLFFLIAGGAVLYHLYRRIRPS